ncbi:MAG TPA: carbamoyltransferase HypF [Streptosporangiaceae bacterium]|nr:carbamoyltransferase HypF [Streptosporangiaceae bacterium]
MSQRIRTGVRVNGIVQGVGFRPFVYSLAMRLGLAGHVGNDSGGVFAEVEGTAEVIADFLAALRREAPPLASIEVIETKPMSPHGSGEFVIVPSEPGGEHRALISADTATCDDCLAELGDPENRRYRYPFINCVNCGPRFTIVKDVPYDRPFTTMAAFDMCAECAGDYHDPANRRFHAQPVCCPRCGPSLSLRDADGRERLAADPIQATASLLGGGHVVAIKGLGGYHLAADATSEVAAARLRERKHREDKPFAVMVAGLAQAEELCEVDDTARRLLTSRRRPVVLLPRRARGGIAEAVAPANRQLGLMLPYTPLHHLLLRELTGPIVLTSGNVSDEPIAYTDHDAVARLGEPGRGKDGRGKDGRGKHTRIADAFLMHERAIQIRTDDSVTRSFRGKEAIIRRARGYAPEPLTVATPFTKAVLACGAELKSTFCLGAGPKAILSPHIGDLENAETLRSFTDGIEHLSRLFDFKPELIAHDLHPDYLSTKYAQDEAGRLGLEAVAVQHHHAHIASCLADNGAEGPVIGVAFDGTGYGADGTIWGGEFLVADPAQFSRAGHLASVPMPGGAAAIRQPWRMAAAYLDDSAATLDVARRNADRWQAVTAMGRKGINSPLTSSAGRLFDAVAAILGVRDVISYEGQAAIELEQLAAPGECGSYPVRIEDGDDLLIGDTRQLIAAIVDDVGGTSRDVIAARFHNAVADLIVACAGRLRDRTGLGIVALSGGVFANLRLSDSVAGRLEANGFTVLTHSRVPCNDGGISLGQAVIAASHTTVPPHPR